MQFKDLPIGEKFKYKDKGISGDKIRIKVHIVTNGIHNVPSYGHMSLDNTVFFYTPGYAEKEVLTLQKVKKTEKKWVKKTLRDVVAGTEFTFWAGTAGEKYTKLQSNAEDLKGKVFYVGTAVKCLYNSFPWTEVYVEEDTIIETEEWLP